MTTIATDGRSMAADGLVGCGDAITDTRLSKAREMIATAKRLDIMVSLDMNGTHLLALPTSTMAEIQRDYETQLRIA